MERNTHKINAEKEVLGRLASRISVLLRGKNKPGYSPHKDMGDFVVVENTDKIKITGNKVQQKKYYRHTGYLGGLKEDSYQKQEEKKPGEALRKAVYGMLPKNKLRAQMIKRLKLKKNG
jgi:large subunit ribosomal protein L13